MKIKKLYILTLIFSIFIGTHAHGEITRGVVAAGVASVASIGASWYLHRKEAELRDKRDSDDVKKLAAPDSEQDLELKIKACKFGKWAAGVVGTVCGVYAVGRGVRKKVSEAAEKPVKKTISQPQKNTRSGVKTVGKMIPLDDNYKIFCAKVENGAIGIVKYVDPKDKNKNFAYVTVFNKIREKREGMLSDYNKSRMEFCLKGSDVKLLDEQFAKHFDSKKNCKKTMNQEDIEAALGNDIYALYGYNWFNFFDRYLNDKTGNEVGELQDGARDFVVSLFLKSVWGGHIYKSMQE